jgi:hypothetical protein
VGTQALVCAYAQLGKFDEIAGRYKDLRGGKTGNPRVLDSFLLCGLARGNNHKEAASAKEALDAFEASPDPSASFCRRKLLLALGLHEEVADVELSKNMPVVLEEGVEYSRLFHECVALLKAGSADEVLARTEPYIKFSIEAGMGVYTDAALLRAIALKVLK